jgi:hypothetical protein
MKDSREDIFIKNTQLCEEDIALFATQPQVEVSNREISFFRRMQEKELGEFAPSADLILSEHNNTDQIYIVRYYFTEYRIGRGRVNERVRENIYTDSLSEALCTDLFQLLDRHITLLDWLREVDFTGIDYDGNYALH